MGFFIVVPIILKFQYLFSKGTGKIFTKNNISPPVEGRCGYFVKRKQRYCKMKPTKGTTFCAEHGQHDEKVGSKMQIKVTQLSESLLPEQQGRLFLFVSTWPEIAASERYFCIKNALTYKKLLFVVYLVIFIALDCILTFFLLHISLKLVSFLLKNPVFITFLVCFISNFSCFLSKSLRYYDNKNRNVIVMKYFLMIYWCYWNCWCCSWIYNIFLLHYTYRC